jgi:hypothetical protein
MSLERLHRKHGRRVVRQHAANLGRPPMTLRAEATSTTSNRKVAEMAKNVMRIALIVEPTVSTDDVIEIDDFR